MFRNSMYTVALGAFFSLFSLSVLGQDLEKDMAEIGKKMEEASSISIAVDVKVFSKKGGNTVYSGNAALIKSGTNVKSVLGEMEFVNTPSYEVRVDHEEKGVLIFKKESATDSKVPKSEKVDFDVEALKKLIESEEGSQKKPTIKLVSSAGGLKKYSITGTPGVLEVVMELDMNAKKITTVRFEYGDANSKGQYVVLSYTKFAYDTDVSSAFVLTNYFTETGNTYTLSSKLKGYHIYTDL